jgi:hypothetical protein
MKVGAISSTSISSALPPDFTDGPASAKKPNDEWSLLLKNSGFF